MKKNFTDNEYEQLNDLISMSEKRTGAQIVLACVDRCDSYPELPWKAFAFGSALSGFLFLFLDLFHRSWSVPVLCSIAATLAGGAVFALFAVLVPAFAKWFLSTYRIETEVKQYAQSLFLEHELFSTRNRRGVLLLIALFEKRVEILPDRGLNDQLTDQTLRNVIDEMIPLLKRRAYYQAFKSGLHRLSEVLESDTEEKRENELPDRIIEEKGE